MGEKMKPCPFCGAKPVVSADMAQFPQVACDACGASGGSGKEPGVGAAISAWNTRADDWRGMDSAPRDGTRFLAWNALGHVEIISWSTRLGTWLDDNREWGHNVFAAWRPLPAPPVEGE